MLFCPWDGTLLTVAQGFQTEFLCPCCPYKHAVTKSIKVQVPTKRKQIEAVMGTDMFATAPKTEHSCDKCGHNEAAYKEMQLRSADEPMSVFYMCMKCLAVERVG
mmetsp:Transcript_59026/g.118501  ORF Transcript_59026/g.118501 Transcript_59026/m.118501 type:complete len:105 (-) Transcript_59026:253-567(-)|eukprot:CAMPEP_0171661484 /NCGR_PEP_ID=MMETSP0990-20121206/44959_1 /TAXON_ID=483369 /ORGANISM="non described non described, Strain CCMP2098" /LENGTH=104 /DNA_ID=CAMNT_0012243667 /DNA_START=107 /DNA_END=421 /DNA_ORIENTATION=+